MNWGDYRVGDVQDNGLHHLVGRTIADVARDRAMDAFDTFCDIAVADRLQTGWTPLTVGEDDPAWTDRVSLLRDPRVVVGASDAGAHLDMISSYAMYTTFLAEAVRIRGILSFEEAIHLTTQVPAALYGLKGRGYLAEGAHADIILFDPATVGRGPVVTRRDLPAAAQRLHVDPLGIHDVIVNGVPAVHDCELTGSLPGRVLRSGRNTGTPSLTTVSRVTPNSSRPT